MPWYKAGTVSVVQNSNAVIGVGTAFIANSRVGDAFRGPDGGWYEVTNIASDTAMSIAPNYQGATYAAGTYALAPMQGYVKESADALRALVNQFGGVLAVLGQTPTTAGVRASLNLSTTDGLSEGGTNKYMTAAGVRSTTLTGLDLTVKTPVVATDTLLISIGKLQAGKAANGANSDITELNALTRPMSAAQGGVSSGYIEGLIPQWNSSNSITVMPGAAYIPGQSKTLNVTSALTLSGLSLAASTWYYLYLYESAGTPAVELVTTAPSAPYSGTARSKAGDTSRRFIMAIRAQLTNAMRPFLWSADYVNYVDSANTYAALVSGMAAVPTPVSLAAAVPTTTRRYLFEAYAGGPGSFNFGFSNPDILVSVSTTIRFMGSSITDASQNIYYINTSSATAGSTLDIRGYGSER